MANTTSYSFYSKKPMPLTMLLTECLAILVFVYFYPRVLLSIWGQENPWLNFFYMYGFGLVFYLVGIQLILNSKAVQFKRGHDKFWFKILFAGFMFFFSLHGVWILLALHYPVKTGVN